MTLEPMLQQTLEVHGHMNQSDVKIMEGYAVILQQLTESGIKIRATPTTDRVKILLRGIWRDNMWSNHYAIWSADQWTFSDPLL